MRFLCIFLVLATAAGLATADTVTASQDTYISEHPVLGGANATHGSDTVLFSIYANGGAPAFRAFPLVEFDLTSYAGKIVSGPATLELYVSGTGIFPQNSRPVSVHEVLISWTDATATYNNFGAASGVQPGTDIGSALDTQLVAYPAPGDRYVSWTIPTATVQGWIDDPASNYGLLIFNQVLANRQDLQFSSMEGDNAPRLSLDWWMATTGNDAPEPSVVALLALGCIALLTLRRRRTRPAAV